MKKWMIVVCVCLLMIGFILPVTAQDGPPPNSSPPPDVATPMPEAAVETETQQLAPDEPFAILDTTQLLIDARFDMEMLVMLTERPFGWDAESAATDPIAIRLNLELLAGTLLGAENRPNGWFGVVASTPYAIARDIRHDLDLLVDTVLEARPDGWIGAPVILSCDRSTQALVMLLNLNGVFVLETSSADPNFCEQIKKEATVFVEVNYLANPGDIDFSQSEVLATALAATNSRFAILFTDRSASVRLGIMPEGTGFQPIARSYAQYSNMIYVRSTLFSGFLDYRYTTLPEEQFAVLPDVTNIETPSSCNAEWCD